MRNAIIALLLLLIVACSPTEKSSAPDANVAESGAREQQDREDLAVLQAVLRRRCNSTDKKYFVLVSDPGELPASQPPADAPQDAAADLVERNTATTKLPEGLACEAVRLATRAELDAAFANRPPDSNRMHFGWESFYAKYPEAHGLMRLSLPGYASDRSMAVVSVSLSSGMRSGFAWMLVLRRHAGEWSVVERIPTWIA